MGKHIIAIIVYNRTSIRTSLLQLLFIIISFESLAIARTHFINPSENHDNYLFNIGDDIGTYDDLSFFSRLSSRTSQDLESARISTTI